MKTFEEIKKHLRRGDLVKVASASGLTVDNVRKTLQRPGAKRHNDVLKKADEVAKFNQSIGL